jgi:hypothetical protein
LGQSRESEHCLMSPIRRSRMTARNEHTTRHNDSRSASYTARERFRPRGGTVHDHPVARSCKRRSSATSHFSDDVATSQSRKLETLISPSCHRAILFRATARRPSFSVQTVPLSSPPTTITTFVPEIASRQSAPRGERRQWRANPKFENRDHPTLSGGFGPAPASAVQNSGLISRNGFGGVGNGRTRSQFASEKCSRFREFSEMGYRETSKFWRHWRRRELNRKSAVFRNLLMARDF